MSLVSSAQRTERLGHLPEETDNTIYVASTPDPEGGQPFKMRMVTQLTEDQVQQLDTVAAAVVACLGESQYYFKDMSLSGHRGYSLWPSMDPTEAFKSRMEQLVGMADQVKSVDGLYLDSILVNQYPNERNYREVVLPDEIENLVGRIPPEILSATLEFNPVRPKPPPDESDSD
jgi:hypothetical protein